MKNDLFEFVRAARLDKLNEKRIFEMEPPPIGELPLLEALAGLELADFRRILDSFAVRHIFKNHGNEAAEKARGQIAVAEIDFLNIPLIVNDFDEISVEVNRIGNRTFLYKKEMPDFRLICAEETRLGRRELAVQTLYKQKIRKSAATHGF